MSNLTHLIAEARKSARSPSKAQPFDQFSKAELWDRLRAVEAALKHANDAAQRTATTAHNYAQGSSGEVRRQFLTIRAAAYSARVSA